MHIAVDFLDKTKALNLGVKGLRAAAKPGAKKASLTATVNELRRKVS